MRRLPLGALLVATSLAATPALSLTPLPVCDGAVESGMTVSSLTWLGDRGGSAYTVEVYADARAAGGQASRVTPPVEALVGFVGTRVVECTSGRFVLIDSAGDSPFVIAAALSATEFLRNDLQAGRSPDFASVQRAAEALYGPVNVLRETAETCGCRAAFPDRRPASLIPYAERPDLG